MTRGAAVAILAGGRATRFGGRDKAFVKVDGAPVIARQLRALGDLADEVLVVTKNPASFRDYRVRAIADRYPGAGPLAGIDAALAEARGGRVLVVACDMPDVSPRVARLLFDRAAADGSDVVVPVAAGSMQPLFAVYGPRVAPIAQARIEAGQLRAVELPDAAARAGLRVTQIGEMELVSIDPQLRSFANLNAPGDRARRRS